MNWITVEKSYKMNTNGGQEPWEPAITYRDGKISMRKRVLQELAGRNIEVRVCRDNGKVSIMLAYSGNRTPHSRLITTKSGNISLTTLRSLIGVDYKTLPLSAKTAEGLVFSEK